CPVFLPSFPTRRSSDLSATFTLAVRQPPAATIREACSGPTAGTVTLTGIRSRTGSGQPSRAASSQAAHQRAHSRGPYSGNGENRSEEHTSELQSREKLV